MKKNRLSARGLDHDHQLITNEKTMQNIEKESIECPKKKKKRRITRNRKGRKRKRRHDMIVWKRNETNNNMGREMKLIKKRELAGQEKLNDTNATERHRPQVYPWTRWKCSSRLSLRLKVPGQPGTGQWCERGLTCLVSMCRINSCLRPNVPL